MAPPLGLTRSMSGFELALPGQHDRGEGLVDLEHVDVVDGQAVVRQQLAGWRGSGRSSMSTGSHPTRHTSTMVASGVSPRASARSRVMSSTAPAPSAICDEVPAVWTPSGRPVGLSVASGLERRLAQALVAGHVWVVPSRLALVVEIGRGDRHDLGARTGPRPRPGAARSWESLPNSSQSARVMPHFSAMRSAPSNWLVNS